MMPNIVCFLADSYVLADSKNCIFAFGFMAMASGTPIRRSPIPDIVKNKKRYALL